MPSTMEMIVTKRYRICESDARKIISKSRAALDLSKSYVWSKAFEAECFRRCDEKGFKRFDAPPGRFEFFICSPARKEKDESERSREDESERSQEDDTETSRADGEEVRIEEVMPGTEPLEKPRRKSKSSKKKRSKSHSKKKYRAKKAEVDCTACEQEIEEGKEEDEEKEGSESPLTDYFLLFSEAVDEIVQDTAKCHARPSNLPALLYVSDDSSEYSSHTSGFRFFWGSGSHSNSGSEDGSRNETRWKREDSRWNATSNAPSHGKRTKPRRFGQQAGGGRQKSDNTSEPPKFPSRPTALSPSDQQQKFEEGAATPDPPKCPTRQTSAELDDLIRPPINNENSAADPPAESSAPSARIPAHVVSL